MSRRLPVKSSVPKLRTSQLAQGRDPKSGAVGGPQNTTSSLLDNSDASLTDFSAVVSELEKCDYFEDALMLHQNAIQVALFHVAHREVLWRQPTSCEDGCSRSDSQFETLRSAALSGRCSEELGDVDALAQSVVEASVVEYIEKANVYALQLMNTRDLDASGSWNPLPRRAAPLRLHGVDARVSSRLCRARAILESARGMVESKASFHVCETGAASPKPTAALEPLRPHGRRTPHCNSAAAARPGEPTYKFTISSSHTPVCAKECAESPGTVLKIPVFSRSSTRQRLLLECATVNNLGLLFFKQAQYASAEEHFQKSLLIEQELDAFDHLPPSQDQHLPACPDAHAPHGSLVSPAAAADDAGGTASAFQDPHSLTDGHACVPGPHSAPSPCRPQVPTTSMGVTLLNLAHVQHAMHRESCAEHPKRLQNPSTWPKLQEALRTLGEAERELLHAIGSGLARVFGDEAPELWLGKTHGSQKGLQTAEAVPTATAPLCSASELTQILESVALLSAALKLHGEWLEACQSKHEARSSGQYFQQASQWLTLMTTVAEELKHRDGHANDAKHVVASGECLRDLLQHTEQALNDTRGKLGAVGSGGASAGSSGKPRDGGVTSTTSSSGSLGTLYNISVIQRDLHECLQRCNPSIRYTSVSPQYTSGTSPSSSSALRTPMTPQRPDIKLRPASSATAARHRTLRSDVRSAPDPKRASLAPYMKPRAIESPAHASRAASAHHDVTPQGAPNPNSGALSPFSAYAALPRRTPQLTSGVSSKSEGRQALKQSGRTDKLGAWSIRSAGKGYVIARQSRQRDREGPRSGEASLDSELTRPAPSTEQDGELSRAWSCGSDARRNGAQGIFPSSNAAIALNFCAGRPLASVKSPKVAQCHSQPPKSSLAHSVRGTADTDAAARVVQAYLHQKRTSRIFALSAKETWIAQANKVMLTSNSSPQTSSQVCGSLGGEAPYCMVGGESSTRLGSSCSHRGGRSGCENANEGETWPRTRDAPPSKVTARPSSSLPPDSSLSNSQVPRIQYNGEAGHAPATTEEHSTQRAPANGNSLLDGTTLTDKSADSAAAQPGLGEGSGATTSNACGVLRENARGGHEAPALSSDSTAHPNTAEEQCSRRDHTDWVRGSDHGGSASRSASTERGYSLPAVVPVATMAPFSAPSPPAAPLVRAERTISPSSPASSAPPSSDFEEAELCQGTREKSISNASGESEQSDGRHSAADTADAKPSPALRYLWRRQLHFLDPRRRLAELSSDSDEGNGSEGAEDCGGEGLVGMMSAIQGAFGDAKEVLKPLEASTAPQSAPGAATVLRVAPSRQEATRPPAVAVGKRSWYSVGAGIDGSNVSPPPPGVRKAQATPYGSREATVEHSSPESATSELRNRFVGTVCHSEPDPPAAHGVPQLSQESLRLVHAIHVRGDPIESRINGRPPRSPAKNLDGYSAGGSLNSSVYGASGYWNGFSLGLRASAHEVLELLQTASDISELRGGTDGQRYNVAFPMVPASREGGFHSSLHSPPAMAASCGSSSQVTGQKHGNVSSVKSRSEAGGDEPVNQPNFRLRCMQSAMDQSSRSTSGHRSHNGHLPEDLEARKLQSSGTDLVPKIDLNRVSTRETGAGMENDSGYESVAAEDSYGSLENEKKRRRIDLGVGKVVTPVANTWNSAEAVVGHHSQLRVPPLAKEAHKSPTDPPADVVLPSHGCVGSPTDGADRDAKHNARTLATANDGGGTVVSDGEDSAADARRRGLGSLSPSRGDDPFAQSRRSPQHFAMDSMFTRMGVDESDEEHIVVPSISDAGGRAVVPTDFSLGGSVQNVTAALLKFSSRGNERNWMLPVAQPTHPAPPVVPPVPPPPPVLPVARDENITPAAAEETGNSELLQPNVPARHSPISSSFMTENQTALQEGLMALECMDPYNSSGHDTMTPSGALGRCPRSATGTRKQNRLRCLLGHHATVGTRSRQSSYSTNTGTSLSIHKGAYLNRSHSPFSSRNGAGTPLYHYCFGSQVAGLPSGNFLEAASCAPGGYMGEGYGGGGDELRPPSVTFTRSLCEENSSSHSSAKVGRRGLSVVLGSEVGRPDMDLPLAGCYLMGKAKSPSTIINHVYPPSGDAFGYSDGKHAPAPWGVDHPLRNAGAGNSGDGGGAQVTGTEPCESNSPQVKWSLRQAPAPGEVAVPSASPPPLQPTQITSGECGSSSDTPREAAVISTRVGVNSAYATVSPFSHAYWRQSRPWDSADAHFSTADTCRAEAMMEDTNGGSDTSGVWYDSGEDPSGIRRMVSQIIHKVSFANAQSHPTGQKDGPWARQSPPLSDGANPLQFTEKTAKGPNGDVVSLSPAAHAAAKTIQSFFRRLLTRRRFQRVLLEHRDHAMVTNATILIQRHWRSWATRRAATQ